MLPDIRQIIMRSGPCVDSLPALDFYLSALESPVLKWPLILLRLKFTPDILEKIRASGLPAEEKGRLFSRAMTLFRSGGAYKTTAVNRSPLTDRAVMEKVRPGDLLLETGVSDGISAANLLAGVKNAEIILSDRQSSFRYLDRGCARFFYDNENGALAVRLPGFYLCAGIAAGPIPEDAGVIRILNPLLEERFKAAELVAFDIFSGSLPRKANIIKCANVLSNIGFSVPQMKAAVANLAKNLANNGWLFISQNNAKYRNGEAFIALQETDGRLALRQEVNGHEILEHLRSPLFSDLLVPDAALSAAAPATDRGEDFLHYIYRRIAGERPGEGAKKFIRHLSWIGISFAVAKVISSLVNIGAGRMLGPLEYGKINVLVSTGAVISPFLLAGLGNSVIKYGVVKEDRDRVFSTAGALFLGLVLLMSAVTLLFRTPLSSFFGIGEKMLFLALAYAIATSSFLLASSMQQASGSFSGRGLSEMIFSALLAAGFFLGVRFLGRVYDAMAYAYIAAFGCLALFWLLRIGRATHLSLLNKEQFLSMSAYGAYSFGGGLASFFLFNVQSLILNAFLLPREVGIYAAYYTATIGIAGYLGYAINTVLFPKASASNDRRRLWKLAAKGWTRLAPFAVLFFMAAEAAVLSLMGKHQYGMDAWMMLFFALCSTLLLVQSSLMQILAAGGVRALRIGMFLVWGAGLFNFAACLLLIPRFRIIGAAGAFILTYVLQLLWLRRYGDSWLE